MRHPPPAIPSRKGIASDRGGVSRTGPLRRYQGNLVSKRSRVGAHLVPKESFTVSGSTPTPWSGPFRDHGLRPWSQSQRFRKGVGGRGLATNKLPKRAQKVLQKCVTILLSGRRKKGTEKRPKSLVFEGFLRANPLCPPTPFRNF